MDSPILLRALKRVVHQNIIERVIAEIGNNHQGCKDTCIEMFVAVKTAGADAVKLQKRNNRMTCTHMQRTPHTITARTTHLEIPTVHIVIIWN